ncbi:MAG: hypothetical protein AUJ75_04795 [Candidatus Omnitrophica bacterium CG1_02_49_10]|nr:MAG: hypothetical protein AUJ75_04795 [Candidatus Omnitrophica bacterium CG1_02_49_10]
MKKLAIIAGSGEYPIIFARSAKEKVKEVIAIAVEGQAAAELEKEVDRIYWVGPGELKKLAAIFLKERVRDVALVGKISKDILYKGSLKLDEEAKKLLEGTSDRRGDSILKSFADKLESFGINVIDATTFVSEYIAKEGIFTERKPDEKERQDIDFGISIARRMASLSIGQTIVVKNKDILAVEAVEGTDEAIRRGGRLGGKGIVVVKMSRPDQDMRFDIPVIGTGTINTIAEAGGSVLAIEKDRTLFFERDPAIDIAEKNGISIVAV